MTIPVDKLTRTYIRIRDKREELKREFEEQDAALKEQLDTLEAALLDVCKATGTDSLRTEFGTVSRVTKTRYWAADWAKMHEFIMQHEAPFLLEKRVAQKEMEGWLTEHPELVPPGLNTDSRYAVTVRRARGK